MPQWFTWQEPKGSTCFSTLRRVAATVTVGGDSSITAPVGHTIHCQMHTLCHGPLEQIQQVLRTVKPSESEEASPCVCVCVCVCVRASARSHARSVMSDALRPHGLYPDRLLCTYNFPGKNTRVGCHFLPPSKESSQLKDQTRVSCIGRWILYQLCHLGSP